MESHGIDSKRAKKFEQLFKFGVCRTPARTCHFVEQKWLLKYLLFTSFNFSCYRLTDTFQNDDTLVTNYKQRERAATKRSQCFYSKFQYIISYCYSHGTIRIDENIWGLKLQVPRYALYTYFSDERAILLIIYHRSFHSVSPFIILSTKSYSNIQEPISVFLKKSGIITVVRYVSMNLYFVGANTHMRSGRKTRIQFLKHVHVLVVVLRKS